MLNRLKTEDKSKNEKECFINLHKKFKNKLTDNPNESLMVTNLNLFSIF